ncbi:MAG TPA: iron dependent repressor, metal binding and dimerization domain protein [Candidatus Bathyarchaeia archaeon]|nr:iron dependent repressor, metal binding and dimerization domain protein [Candidatus Bathyarchaeia archaeon]
MARTRPEKGQLAKLARAHRPSAKGQTPRKEDYVEIIYELIREKGYAKPVDIAKHLHVRPPTVTGMLDRLHSEQLILHEKYGGITLTEEGENMARALGQRHALLVAFLKLFGVEETSAQKDTEGLEHYIDSRTLDLLAKFVKYVDLNPQWWSLFRKQAKV